MKTKLLLFIFLVSAITISAQQAPESAEKIMTGAYAEAAKTNKNVFVMFHASWCGWCHKMDDSMNDPLVKKYFDDNFVIRHLVVKESKDKKNLENPGAEDMLIKYKGNEHGIPFWLIFDSKGQLLADSKERPEGASLNDEGKNVGCPAAKNEVEHFIKVLKKTTRLKENDLTVIEKRFRENEQ